MIAGQRARRLRTRELRDGTIGYFVRYPRKDDCFAAALATVLQVPIEDIPDPRIDERLAAGETSDAINRAALDELDEWLGRRGMRMLVHDRPPVRRRRWIGVVRQPGAFQDHCLVMAGAEMLFDPVPTLEDIGMGYLMPPRTRVWRAEDVDYGLDFQARRTAQRRTKGA